MIDSFQASFFDELVKIATVKPTTKKDTRKAGLYLAGSTAIPTAVGGAGSAIFTRGIQKETVSKAKAQRIMKEISGKKLLFPQSFGRTMAQATRGMMPQFTFGKTKEDIERKEREKLLKHQKAVARQEKAVAKFESKVLKGKVVPVIQSGFNPAGYAAGVGKLTGSPDVSGKKGLVMMIPGYLGADKPNPYALAHEAGHLSGLSPDKVRKLFRLSIAGRAAPLASLGVLPFMRSEKAETAGYVAGGAGALASAPLLAEEGRASIKALQGLKRLGYSRAKALKLLGPAYATYLGLAALSTGAPIAAGKYFAAKARARKLKEKKGR